MSEGAPENCPPTDASTSRPSILRAAGVVASMTALSRILGFIRSIVIAALFSREATDAFWVAFRIPNLLRRLFAEGALTISFVPVYTEIEERDGREAAERVAHIAFSVLAIITGLVALVGIALSPWIARVFAPGFFHGGATAQGELTITLLRITFPYIVLVSFMALCQGVLNARRHFFAPAAAPALLNIVMIACAFGLSGVFERPVIAVAVGVIVGGLVQVLVHIPFLHGVGYRFRPDFSLDHPAVRRMLTLMGPAAFGLLVYQFNILISTVFASLLDEGSVSYLFYANQLTELPLGIFAVAIGTASLPQLSRDAIGTDKTRFLDTFRSSLSLVIFLTLPATLGLMMLADPIVGVLFQRGEFGAEGTLGTAAALVYFAAGIPAVAGVRVTAQAFYALQDTRTPVRTAFIAFLVNIPLSVLLMGPRYLDRLFVAEGAPPRFAGTVLDALPISGASGLALATSLAAAVNIGVLLWLLHRRLGSLGGWALGRSLLKSVGAAVVLGGFLLGAWSLGGDFLRAEPHNAAKALALGSALVGGMAVYFVAAAVLRHEELDRVWRRIRRRRGAS